MVSPEPLRPSEDDARTTTAQLPWPPYCCEASNRMLPERTEHHHEKHSFATALE